MTLKSRDEVIEDVKNIGAFLILPAVYGLEAVLERKRHFEKQIHDFIDKKTAVSRYSRLIEEFGFPDLGDFFSYYAADACFLERYKKEPEIFSRLMQTRRQYFDQYRGRRMFQ